LFYLKKRLESLLILSADLVWYVGTGGSSRTREWAVMTGRMGLASPFITFVNIKNM
jgi:hypothetical protein